MVRVSSCWAERNPASRLPRFVSTMVIAADAVYGFLAILIARQHSDSPGSTALFELLAAAAGARLVAADAVMSVGQFGE